MEQQIVGLMIESLGMSTTLGILGLAVIGAFVFCLLPLIVRVGQLESSAEKSISGTCQ